MRHVFRIRAFTNDRDAEAGGEALDGLAIETLHSHLACADEDNDLNAKQLRRFREVAAVVPAIRYSLANSAGIYLGRDYSFDLVRPGLALYGGIPRREAEGSIRQVARVEAQIVQRRTVADLEARALSVDAALARALGGGFQS